MQLVYTLPHGFFSHFFQGNSKPHVIVFGISGGTPHNIFTQNDFETDSYGAS